MWFRNLTLYRFTEPFPLNGAELADKLSPAAFRVCGRHEVSTHGWAPPLGRKAADLVHAVTGYSLVCLQAEEKVLPAAVVKEMVAAKVAEIEDREMRRVFSKEKERLREDIFQRLLSQAFTRIRKSYAYIDTRGGWLIIDSASRKLVEEMTSALRKTLGSLAIIPPRVAAAPAVIMTDWLSSGELPAGFTLEDECELRDGEEGAVVRCKGQDLTGPEIQPHLNAGKQVARLALQWDNRIAFVLSEDLTLRRMRFLDLVQEQLDDSNRDSAEELFDAQFALMTGELTVFLPRLLEVFGGEVAS